MATEKIDQFGKSEIEPETIDGGAYEEDKQIKKSGDNLPELRRPTEHTESSIQSTQTESPLESERDEAENIREQARLLSIQLVETRELQRKMGTRLDRIEASPGVRFERMYHAFTDRLFPYGTLRREVYRRTVSRLIKAILGIGDAALATDISPNLQTVSLLPVEASPAAVDEYLKAGPVKDIFLHCYSPQPGEVCGRRPLIRGWAAALGRVLRVEILVDNEKLGEAVLWPPPPEGEADRLRSSPKCSSSFFYFLKTPSALCGGHTITLRAEVESGARKELLIPVTISEPTENRIYAQWIRANEPSPARLASLLKEAKRFSYTPSVSIATPVFDASEKLLKEIVASAREQIYPNWELCLAVDTPSSLLLAGFLEAISREDSRIKYIQMPEGGGMADAMNAAISLSTSEFVAFMECDGLLSPDALHWNIKLLQEHRDADLIYSDEDKVDQAGVRCDPFFKPDLSPDLLLSNNYIGELLVVRRQLLKEIGGLREENDGTRNYDLVLRLVERTQRIFHIPRILYHRRNGNGRGVSPIKANSPARVNEERALTDYLNRNRIPGRVEPGCTLGQWQVRYEIIENPKVGVIIPTGGRMELLQPCLESLLSLTSYPHYEILLVDNSRGQQVEQFAKSRTWNNGVLRYLDYRDRKFNFSALNNFAVRQAEVPLLLFLNDDTTIVNPDWLSSLVEHGQRPKVGAVGAKLIYPSGNIQHAGVVMGIYECTSHAFKHLPGDTLHYFAFAQTIRNCSAVTAACMLTRKSVFMEVDGFDEERLMVAFQDVDYCLKICKAGYSIVYTPLAVLIHHESVTKIEKIPIMKEVRHIQKKWRDVIAHDPFYSPNLTRKTEDYSLRLD